MRYLYCPACDWVGWDTGSNLHLQEPVVGITTDGLLSCVALIIAGKRRVTMAHIVQSHSNRLSLMKMKHEMESFVIARDGGVYTTALLSTQEGEHHAAAIKYDLALSCSIIPSHTGSATVLDTPEGFDVTDKPIAARNKIQSIVLRCDLSKASAASVGENQIVHRRTDHHLLAPHPVGVDPVTADSAVVKVRL